MRSTVICIVLFSVLGLSSATDVCPPGEESVVCIEGVCRAKYCSEKGQPIPCPDIRDGPCTSGCICPEGYLRNERHNNCVPENECPGPSCGKNEIRNECPSVCTSDACPKNVSNVTPKPCIAVCGKPRCECIKNYKRDKNGKCIPIEKCRNICPVNEEFSTCTQSLCRAQNCSQKNQPIACPRIAKGFCKQGCVCVTGTLRNNNGRCIPEEKCPKPKCGDYEQYNECTSVCNSDACPTQNGENQKPCVDVCGPPKCECIPNYKRNKNGICVPIQECPKVCPINEEYSNCIQGLCRAQKCSEINQPIACADLTEGSCQRGCVCIKGTLRDRNGNCIPEKQCAAAQKCGKNERYNECTSVCFNDTCPKNLSDINNVGACILLCGPPKCECITDYRRNSKGKCIPIGNCPGICPVNEKYSSCIQSQCDSQYCVKNTTACREMKGACQPGCICVEGTLRDASGKCVPVSQCPKPQCNKENEEEACVFDCPPEKTCKNRGIQFSCIQSVKPCLNKCVCKEGYFRNFLGLCVSGAECDLCKGKNEFFNCGQECDNECKMLGIQNRTHCPFINIQCNRKCYCEDGFARDNNNICIPVDKCPKVKRCADPNEEYLDCKKTCPPDSCFSLVARFKCPAEPKCEPGCSCKSGFLRQNETSGCLPICECSEMKYSPDCLNKTRVY